MSKNLSLKMAITVGLSLLIMGCTTMKSGELSQELSGKSQSYQKERSLPNNYSNMDGNQNHTHRPGDLNLRVKGTPWIHCFVSRATSGEDLLLITRCPIDQGKLQD